MVTFAQLFSLSRLLDFAIVCLLVGVLGGRYADSFWTVARRLPVFGGPAIAGRVVLVDPGLVSRAFHHASVAVVPMGADAGPVLFPVSPAGRWEIPWSYRLQHLGGAPFALHFSGPGCPLRLLAVVNDFPLFTVSVRRAVSSCSPPVRLSTVLVPLF